MNYIRPFILAALPLCLGAAGAVGTELWSLAPVASPAIPVVTNTAWPRNTIDRFVLARLEHEKLAPAPEVDRATWLRRVSLDLTGLPPAPARIDAFVADALPDAHERAVDDLLASPRHGERWAQHWLDVVRYADTHGFEVNTERPNAWPYRDYIIHAFNEDLPYDRFIREQLAGDVLGQDAATGFLVTASVLLPGQIGADEPSKRLARQDSLDEIVTNIGQTFLGLGVNCARCHDHKFDPVSQRDYYSMQAFVAGVEYGERELRTPESAARRVEKDRLKARVAELDHDLARFVPIAHPVDGPSKSGMTRAAVNPRLNTDRFAPTRARRVRFTIRATGNLEPCIDELEVYDTAGRNVALASAGTKTRSSGDTVVENRHELRQINDGEYGNSRSWMSNETGKGWVELEFAGDHEIDRVVWGRDRNGEFHDRLATDYRIELADASGGWRLVADATDRATYIAGKSEPAPPALLGLAPDEAREATRLSAERKQSAARIAVLDSAGTAFAGIFRKPDDIHILRRGDPEQPMDPVVPAVPVALGATASGDDTNEAGRRLRLADWIASPTHPLTARVMVNRVWQGHFGTGLVDTPSDFGRNGSKPSHPELLDWLAGEFVRSGWSIKHLHRLVVLSATYGQSARVDPAGLARDADDRLLWRFPSRRLEAETIRDSMLAASGRLDRSMYGRGFDLFDLRGGLTGFKPVESYRGDGLRRMVYAHKVRREREAVFGPFDCPDAGQSTARRRESTTPIQAINLFNSRFTIDESAALAARVAHEAGVDPRNQVRLAWRLALGRDPSPSELDDALAVSRDHGLATVCRAVFNSNEFVFSP